MYGEQSYQYEKKMINRHFLTCNRLHPNDECKLYYYRYLSLFIAK